VQMAWGAVRVKGATAQAGADRPSD